MSRTSLVALCAACLFVPAAAPAQVVNQQIVVSGSGDGPLQMLNPTRQGKTGTAVIRGRVVAADTGQPLRRAQIRLSGPDVGMKSALTDANGRYEFKELPAGRVNLQVSKGGYVNMQYGQNRPFEPGRPLELAEAQVLEKVDVALPRGSVISGRIVDEFGEPVTDVMVSAMRMSYAGGRRRLVPAGRTGATNDLGQFRIYGLPPGDYYVSATYRDVGMMAFDLLGGTGSGTGSAPTSGYAPTYFPGTPSPNEAQKVTVAVGQELNGIDVGLQPVRLSRVAGSVVGSDGAPVGGAMIMLIPASRDAGMFMPGGTSRTNKDGQFTLPGVAPGEYSLQVRSLGPMMVDGGGGAMFFSMTTTNGPAGDKSAKEPEFASVPLSVTGEDVTGLVVTTTHGARASGRVVFEGGAKPEGSTTIRVSAPAADPDGGPAVGAGIGQLKDNGTFELTGLAGTRLIRAGGLPKGWLLKSVQINGVDVTDSGFDFKPGEDVSGVEIELTQRASSVDGTVADAQGEPAKDYTVVVFAQDENKWRLPMSRWIASARPDQEGRFRVPNLPAGSYYAVAVEYVATGEWADPDWLARARDKATSFTVADGTTKSLALKLSGM